MVRWNNGARLDRASAGPSDSSTVKAALIRTSEERLRADFPLQVMGWKGERIQHDNLVKSHCWESPSVLCDCSVQAL